MDVSGGLLLYLWQKKVDGQLLDHWLQCRREKKEWYYGIKLIGYPLAVLWDQESQIIEEREFTKDLISCIRKWEDRTQNSLYTSAKKTKSLSCHIEHFTILYLIFQLTFNISRILSFLYMKTACVYFFINWSFLSIFWCCCFWKKLSFKVEYDVCVYVLITQSCLILCDSMDCNSPGSSAHGILQAGIVEWLAIPFSRGSSQPRDWTWVSHIAGGFFTSWATREA